MKRPTVRQTHAICDSLNALVEGNIYDHEGAD
jgi:hypothetical protein